MKGLSKKSEMNTAQWLEKGCKELKEVTSNPLFESQYLLSSVLNVPLTALHFKENQILSPDSQKEFLKKIQLRKKGFPIAYITGEKEFFKRRFYVGAGVFIPRPETEGLMEAALNLQEPLKGVDFGSGSGCLALSLTLERPDSRFIAVESDSLAYTYLKKNHREWKLNQKVKLLNQDVHLLTLEQVELFLRGKPNVIVANPPYVDQNDEQLEGFVKQFEPPAALFSDQEGLAHIYSWFSKAMELLQSGGVYIFELGYSQNKKVRNFLDEKNQLKSYKIYKDLQGWDRVAVCTKK
ncbi:MAG: peptide chain release factor N(5)-glutamine methyltransferase [Bdellovibrionales bacterium]|nr:peptide chain release factor N(5)-glutamine methyltransferase [Bdellovibrionales bacterium]